MLSKKSTLPHIDDGLKKIYTDIIEATQSNDLSGVKKALLDDPACISFKDANEMTALHWAILINSMEITGFLAEYSHVEKGIIYKADIMAEDRFGRKAIDCARERGNKVMTEYISSLMMPQFFDPDSEWNTDVSNQKVVDFQKPELE
jgi:ankyrin repeat protein